jgi:hypothetical protein
MELALVTIALVLTNLGWPVLLWLCLKRDREHELRVMSRIAMAFEQGVMMERSEAKPAGWDPLGMQLETLNASEAAAPQRRVPVSEFVEFDRDKPSHQDAVPLATRGGA